MSDELVSSLEEVLRLERTSWKERIPAQTTYGLLSHACQKYAGQIALRLLLQGRIDSATQDQTYKSLLEHVNKTANALNALGVKPTTPVAIILPNILENHWALWGAQACGIAAPINPMLEASYISRVCAETKAEVLIAPSSTMSPEVWSKVLNVALEQRHVRTVMVVGDTDDSSMTAMQNQMQRDGLSLVGFNAALDKESGDYLSFERNIQPEEPCAYFLTGGTTASPKVAVHTHCNEAFMAWVLRYLLGTQQVFLSGLPLFHVNGALVTGLGALHAGSEVVLLTPGGFRTPGVLDNFWALANRFGATLFSAVPTIFSTLANKPLPEGGLTTLRKGICGAAPLPPQVRIDFEAATGVQMHEGYGMTEGTCVSSFNPLQVSPKSSGVGIRIPFQELEVFCLSSGIAPPQRAAVGEVGVVAIRGPNVFAGYLREKDNEKLWLSDGWLNTGDLGKLDAHGALHLCGRAKDLIIRGGHNIDPLLIEDALSKHPEVAMVAAVGQPDVYAGEVPVAYVCPKPDTTITAENVLDFARGAIEERAAIPVRIEVLSALPLTAVGKVSKPHLRLLANQYAVRSELAAAGLQRLPVTGRIDIDRGPIVSITLTKSLEQQVRSLLGRFNVAFELKEVQHG